MLEQHSLVQNKILEVINNLQDLSILLLELDDNENNQLSDSFTFNYIANEGGIDDINTNLNLLSKEIQTYFNNDEIEEEDDDIEFDDFDDDDE